MQIDVLVAEIGSTTTVVNAFFLSGRPRFVGQGQSATTVLEGDVCTGLTNAIRDLEQNLGQPVQYREMFATSSAAGGLKMTVHGLIYDMTVKAAREAALGAGGIVKLATAGKMRESDLERVREIRPNLILLAGGTDYGERDTALHNAELLANSRPEAPVIYAGNVENSREIERIFCGKGTVFCTENVYPRLDLLNIEPTRAIIHRVFEQHIVRAPGMERVREMVTGAIMPTPGAVMECARLLHGQIGDLAVVDVGGATTDIHSVTAGSDEIASISVGPEPFAKRTVEGDLGVFVNAPHVIKLLNAEKLSQKLGFDVEKVQSEWQAIPSGSNQTALAQALAECAAATALERHAGHLRHIFTPQGRKTLAEGKDLTQLKWLVATGGALTRLPDRQQIMENIARANSSGMLLFPKPGSVGLLFDRQYIFASLGVLARAFPNEAVRLMLDSLGLDPGD